MGNIGRNARIVAAAIALFLAPQLSHAHVTLQTNQPLRPKANATVTLNVPNERFVANTKVTFAVPEAFLNSGGRLSRIQYPPGWTVTLEKSDKPSEIIDKEKGDRAKRESQKSESNDHGGKAAKSEEEQKEQQAMDEMRKKWITKVTFEGGTIPPEGYQQFQIGLQLPDAPGKYRFPAVQTYADGKEVSWSELVEGAEHPAASLTIPAPSMINYGDLPLPLSGLAVAISLIALLKRSRAPKSSEATSSVPAGSGLKSAVRKAFVKPGLFSA